jgi:5-methylcytosine-specific restriction enzyme A
MKSVSQIKRQYYDRFARDPEARKFYQSSAWQRVRDMKLRRDPLCEACKQAGRDVMAEMVHHLIPIKRGTHNLDMTFLVSLCHRCHNAVESEMEQEERARGSDSSE